jgi:hypothetical protein
VSSPIVHVTFSLGILVPVNLAIKGFGNEPLVLLSIEEVGSFPFVSTFKAEIAHDLNSTFLEADPVTSGEVS